MMRQGPGPLPVVTGDMLDRALERNLEIVESYRGRGSPTHKETVRKIVTGHGRSEVLCYVSEALIEDSGEDSSVRDAP